MITTTVISINTQKVQKNFKFALEKVKPKISTYYLVSHYLSKTLTPFISSTGLIVYCLNIPCPPRHPASLRPGNPNSSRCEAQQQPIFQHCSTPASSSKGSKVGLTWMLNQLLSRVQFSWITYHKIIRRFMSGT